MIHHAVCYYLSDMRTHRPVHGIIKIKVTVSLINYKKLLFTCYWRNPQPMQATFRLYRFEISNHISFTWSI